MNSLLTPVKSELLELLVDGPKPFSALRDGLTQSGNDLRASAVSGLIDDLSAHVWLIAIDNGRYAITPEGRAALTATTAPTGVPRVGKIRKARLGDGPVLRQQGLQREYIIQPTDDAPVSLEMVTLCRGEECTPHAHIDTQTLVYTIKGKVLVSSGPDLADVIEVGPGDCLFIPPDEPHYVVNLWPEPMVAVVARFKPQGVVEFPHLRLRALAAGLAPELMLEGVSA